MYQRYESKNNINICVKFVCFVLLLRYPLGVCYSESNNALTSRLCTNLA